MTRRTRALTVALGAALLSPLAAACTEDTSGSADATAVSVTSSDDACELSVTTAPAGSVVFSVENTGGQATEFYVYEADGETIVGEVEDIGPGLTRELTIDAEAGDYITACKPGMEGDGIRGDFSVTDT